MKICFIFLLVLSVIPSNIKAVDNNTESGIVEEIIDGDTIRLSDGRLIRYIGIDTPELRKKKNGKWYSSPEPFAQNASRFNQDLVEHKEIRLEFDKIKIDNYNRTLAYVFVGSSMVNAELLKAGLAKTLTIPPNKKYVNLFRKLEKEAEYRKIGIWNNGLKND